MPRVLGILLVIAGGAYIAHSVTSLPLDGRRIVSYERVTPLGRAAGECPIMLWLLIKGGVPAVVRRTGLRAVDDLKDLKRGYLELVRIYGEEVTELKRFKQSLLELNRRHRLEAVRMYVNIISKVERKMGIDK